MNTLPVCLDHGHTQERMRANQGVFCSEPGCGWWFRPTVQPDCVVTVPLTPRNYVDCEESA